MSNFKREYFKIYFAKSTDYYLKCLDNYEAKKGYTVNIAAFFLGPIWMLYRKMYLEAGMYMVAVFVLGFIEDYLVSEVFQLSPSSAGSVSRSVNIAIAMGVAFSVNNLYIKKAIATIESLTDDWQEEGLDKTLEDQLRKVGGVSWPSALVGAAVMLAIIGAYVYFTLSEL
jgi:hypothetical protein